MNLEEDDEEGEFALESDKERLEREEEEKRLREQQDNQPALYYATTDVVERPVEADSTRASGTADSDPVMSTTANAASNLPTTKTETHIIFHDHVSPETGYSPADFRVEAFAKLHGAFERVEIGR